ncbi:STAS domain-containing protein [Parafrankia elaeagni]|uniref:STAS domain-containing protein n=1 Tax=Parafrankia elaeagni TaxID=222534 RepID=UPI000373A0A3|nr:STAS domain-containing protein [Parafrankia elaeagni]
MPDDTSALPPLPAAGGSGSSVLRLPALLHRAALPELCGRLEALLRDRTGPPVILDASAVEGVDAVLVETVARLTLLARRHGRALRVVAPPALRELLWLTGLTQLLDGRPADGPPGGDRP